ncbi:MAG TPA: hypothetical protein GXX75_03415 [Clostridiales bacterium]|nr:hypothetical protein [Clostridiales bacterium]
MGSYEKIMKLEEMRRKVDEGDLLSALRILDTIELKKIKHLSDLHLIADVLTENGKYEEAAQIYLKVYEKSKSRKALFQLTEISIKLNNEEDADYFLQQYRKLAPKDFYNYVFRYKLDKLKGESYEHLIGILEELKRVEYTEKWAYELAKLYYKAGMEQKCIDECNDIILWFGDGIFVEKAKILRSYYLSETDTNGIMKEIKRQAGILNEDGLTATPAMDGGGQTGVGDDSGADSMAGQEELVDGLGVEVQGMLQDEMEDTVQEDMLREDTVRGAMVQEAVQPGLNPREIAEQEVEKALYDMLEEENLEKENKKLRQMEEELPFHVGEIFGDFMQVLPVKKQLVNSLDTILQEQSKTSMLIITGQHSSEKTRLAKDLALFLYKTGKLKSSKMAKITAEKLNTLEVVTKKERLKDCCLLIENAGGLKAKTIEGLLELASILQGDIAVIFEEEEGNLNQMFQEYPKLIDLLQNRIHLS